MITILLFVNFLLMIGIAILLGRTIQQRLHPGWGLFGIGAATFVLSQVGHIPFNILIGQTGLLPENTDSWVNLLITAVFLGLSAGVFEESARYLTYRFWAKDARVWRKGLMLGAGHGGAEAMIVGFLGLLNLGIFVLIRNGALQNLIPPEQMPLVQAQIDATFNTPWYMTLLGAVERVFAICFHLSASLMVMQVFVRGQWRWLAAAIGWHTLLNAAAVAASVRWGALAAEGILAVMALVSLWIVFKLRTPELIDESEPVMVPETAVLPPAKQTSTDALERSKYS